MASCLECGKDFRRRGHNGTFCGGVCRRVFNNRRALRGALIYDLTMIANYHDDAEWRKRARDRIQAVLTGWREEDGLRRRYKPAYLAFDDTARFMAVKVG